LNSLSNGESPMPSKPIFLILLGPPMSGKGTQAARLSRSLGVPQVSSGDLFRFNIKNRTELGKQAKAFIDRGDLVPDEITIGMVAQRLNEPDCAGGAILDGFPRTIPQARELDRILNELGASLTGVLSVSVPEDILVERASGRRICRICGKSYHLTFKPPEREGVCDVDGGEIYQRLDDLPETVRQRLAVYQVQTSPLIDFYRERGVLEQLDGNQPIGQVAAEIENVVDSV
jgi:adenylate kinase